MLAPLARLTRFRVNYDLRLFPGYFQAATLITHIKNATTVATRDIQLRTDAWLPHGSVSSCVRQKICFERAAAFSLPLLLKSGGEGRGEEALFINDPSLRLSPRSFLAGRERQNAAGVLRAEHDWSVSNKQPNP